MAVAKYRSSTTGEFVSLGIGSVPGGGASDLDDLTDVALTSRVTGQFLGWDGTQWTNRYPPSVVSAGAVQATPANFPGIDPSGATSSSTGMANFIAAIPDGGIGIIPPGNYLLDDILTITGKSVRVSAHGANIISSDPVGAVLFNGGFEATKTITALTQRLTTLGEYGHGSENMWVTDLTLSAAAPTSWKRGDVLKVVAEEVFPDATGTVRNGQCCIIANVSGSTVTLAGRLRDTFTTGRRCARFLPYRMTWEGGTFRHSDSILNSTTLAPYMFEFNALNAPIVKDVRITASAQAGFYMRKCFAARVDSCTMDYGQDAEATIKLGYGVVDGSEFTTVYNFVAKRVRHLYTTAAGDTPANSSNLAEYGHQYGGTVSDCVCIGATQTAFDTHGDAVQTTFSNCRAIDCYQGFLLRGSYHSVIGGSVLGATAASPITINTSSSSNNSYGSYIGGGLVIDGNAFHTIWVERTRGGVEARPIYVDGVFIRNRNTSFAAVYANSAAVQVGRILATAGGTPMSVVNGGTITPMPYLSV